MGVLLSGSYYPVTEARKVAGVTLIFMLINNGCPNIPCDSEETDRINCFEVGGRVIKGKTKFGNFLFGGSLNILLFSKGMATAAVQTRMGNQIGIINVGRSPKSPWSFD